MNNNQKSIIIGIAGGTACGKTTLCKLIQSIDKNNIVIISIDDYYKKLTDRITKQERNFDHPSSIDWDLFISDINKLANGETIYAPIYSFKTHDRLEATREIKPVPIIIVEGIFALYKYELVNLLYKRIFIEVDIDVMYVRRRLRDETERDRKVDDINEQWTNFVKPAYIKYVEPTNYRAHVKINNNDHINDINERTFENFDIIQVYIKDLLKRFTPQGGCSKELTN